MKLHIKGISKCYGQNKALSDFSAELEPGIYALLGPNGSGKTTLMNIITDNLKADSGMITFEDSDFPETDVFKMGPLFRKKLGYMPQYPGMYTSFTVNTFMWYMATLKNIASDLSEKERRGYISEQIKKILVAVELDDVSDRRIGALSGGMKQRLALAQAVLGAPSILILDEPTAGLDPKQRISIRNYISKIAFDKIVLIATHVVSDIEFIARDVIMLKKGVIVDNAPPHELTKKIDGKVWIAPCAEGDVAAMQERYRVTNISRDEETGEVVLRIIAYEKPTEAAKTASPTLEDYYLYVFGEASNSGE